MDLQHTCNNYHGEASQRIERLHDPSITVNQGMRLLATQKLLRLGDLEQPQGIPKDTNVEWFDPLTHTEHG